MLKELFKASAKAEIDGLIEISVIVLIYYNPAAYIRIYIFKTRFVYKVKNKFNKLYKKLCLVIYGFKDI